MILEAVMLHVKPGENAQFEAAFQLAQAIIQRATGYLSYELHRCLEADNKYLFLVRWETLEDHTEGFRGSDEYQEWKALLHHFYEPFPTVEHFVLVSDHSR